MARLGRSYVRSRLGRPVGRFSPTFPTRPAPVRYRALTPITRRRRLPQGTADIRPPIRRRQLAQQVAPHLYDVFAVVRQALRRRRVRSFVRRPPVQVVAAQPPPRPVLRALTAVRRARLRVLARTKVRGPVGRFAPTFRAAPYRVRTALAAVGRATRRIRRRSFRLRPIFSAAAPQLPPKPIRAALQAVRRAVRRRPSSARLRPAVRRPRFLLELGIVLQAVRRARRRPRFMAIVRPPQRRPVRARAPMITLQAAERATLRRVTRSRRTRRAGLALTLLAKPYAIGRAMQAVKQRAARRRFRWRAVRIVRFGATVLGTLLRYQLESREPVTGLDAVEPRTAVDDIEPPSSTSTIARGQ